MRDALKSGIRRERLSLELEAVHADDAALYAAELDELDVED